MNRLSNILPKTMTGQMIAVLSLSLSLLLAFFIVLEVTNYQDALETAKSEATVKRFNKLMPILNTLERTQIPSFLETTSKCHEGYSVSKLPFNQQRQTSQTTQLERQIAASLGKDVEQVSVTFATLEREDFSYNQCAQSDIKFPMEGVVVSVRLDDNSWVNAEVHHEWHFSYMFDWVLKISGAFIFISSFGIFFIYWLNRPLASLTEAAQSFARGLEPEIVIEKGPADIKKAIQAFNKMQQRVADEVAKRAHTLAAISHDVRSPLTALRLKVELINDEATRNDLILSINKMEDITASALEFLKSEASQETKKKTDLTSLVESECSEFSEMGLPVKFKASQSYHYLCQPDSLASAVRNLVENAVKYGKEAEVSIGSDSNFIDIRVRDKGPGIPENKIAEVLEPFKRLSKARESHQGGFGLGLAVVLAVVEKHQAKLELQNHQPSGMSVIVRLPILSN